MSSSFRAHAHMQTLKHIPYVRAMMAAVRGVGIALVALILLVIVNAQSPLTSFMAWGAFCVLTIAVWVFLFLAARSGAGLVYACRHLLLSVLLTPLFLIGLFVIPFLVRADLQRLQRTLSLES